VQPTGPLYTDEQALGQLGEAQFQAAVVQRGWLYQPTRAGNDFGIDGIVEIRDPDRRLRGLEFRVQVKTMRHLRLIRKGGLISLAGVRTETLAYWLARLTPTLVVAYDATTSTFYHGWAHKVGGPQLDEALQRHRRSVSLRLPATNRLDGEGWREIERYVRDMHDMADQLMRDAGIRSIYDLVYRLAADVSDVLFEWISCLAFSWPEGLAHHLSPGQELDAETIARFRAAALKPPERVTTTGFQGPMWLVSALGTVLHGFVEGALGEGASAENPIVSSAINTNRLLQEFVRRITFADDQGEVHALLEGGASQNLGWVRLDVPNAVTSIGLIAFLLRDFQREMRKWLMPEPPRTTPAGAMQIVRDLSEEFVTAAPSWLPPLGTGEGAA
jgi:hypothetical protein